MQRTQPPKELFLSPRLLTRSQAAAYCSLSLQGFSAWVKLGKLPRPILGTARWDLKKIDEALDILQNNALDQWKAKRARTS
jgi:hypothetical protein